jgi:pre-rRNA-processing protein RIX1
MSTKEMAVVALTKIYLMTHQYQTLVREITTPTLPAFVTACLALVSPKSNKSTVISSLEETIFEALAMLVPRHTSIFRPFASQIRLVARRYIAPTSSDGTFIPLFVKESARRLYVVLHQTAAKNTGAEEWSKAVREFIRETHATADQVFRAVIEDWESNSGYSGPSVDVNQGLSGGGNAAEALPPWSGIFAGTERLIGLLEMLAAYLKEETSAPVALPIGSLMDILNRMLSIAIPSSMSKGASARLHPAIDRDERDALCANLPQVYIAALQLVRSMSERLEGSFLSVAQAVFDQLVWVFPFGKHDQEFCTVAYEITIIVLMRIGQSLSRNQVGKCYDILRSCCKDLEVMDPSLVTDATSPSTKSRTHNADTFLRHIPATAQSNSAQGTTLTHYAQKLLGISLSHIPQHYLDVSMRSMVERTAILSHNKDAMLASVLYPFVGKNGKAMASILPHLTREFGDDATVEILLRPRMPLLPSATRPLLNDAVDAEDMDNDEDMLPPIDAPEPQDADSEDTNRAMAPTMKLDSGVQPKEAHNAFSSNAPSSSSFGFGNLPSSTSNLPAQPPKSILRHTQQPSTDVEMSEAHHEQHKVIEPKVQNGGAEEEESSSDESVHLTMQLDTDSEDDDL